MKNAKYLLYGLAAAGCIPLLLCAPYILNAWRSSPMDSHDYVFVIVFALSALPALLATGHSKPVFQKRILLAALTFLCGYVGCRVISLNAGAIACAIMFWWTWIWLLRGIHLAFNLLPSFMILLLSIVSSVYWICVYLVVSQGTAYRLKLLAMVVVLVAEFLVLRYKWQPKIGVVVFSMGMAAATVTMTALGSVTRVFAPCKVAFQPVIGSYLGRELDRDEGFQRFFRFSDAHHYMYSGDVSDFSFLSINCGSNIHEIHPASHCLRSSGWRIDDEGTLTLVMDDKKFCVTEVKATRGGRPIVLWVWYTNDKISTGNYICFRRLWRNDGQWSTYQLGVIGINDIEDSRKQLQDLLSTIMLK